jgi:hypothetical protein
MRRAGVHLLRAAIEVVEGVGAFLEELQAVRRDDEEDGGETKPQRIPLD